LPVLERKLKRIKHKYKQKIMKIDERIFSRNLNDN
jgi:hypothetical protein